MGPFRMPNGLFKILAIVSVLGVLVVLWIGVQPPNQKALIVTLATVSLLMLGWWFGVQRSFRGPPALSDHNKETQWAKSQSEP